MKPVKVILVTFSLLIVVSMGWLAYRSSQWAELQTFRADSTTAAPQILQTPQPPTCRTVETATDHCRVSLQINSQVLTVEVVNTSASIAQGLSGRSEIGADGMLFVFAQPMMPRFWMKEMKFDLDLLWIQNGVIIDITENVPAPDPTQALSELPTFSAQEPVNWVLEVPAGTAKRFELAVGDQVQATNP